MRFKIFQLAVHGDTHRTRGPFHHRFRCMAVRAMQTGKLFESAVENLFGASETIATTLTFLIQTGQFDTRPELIFKRFRFTASRIENTRSLDDDGPGCD